MKISIKVLFLVLTCFLMESCVTNKPMTFDLTNAIDDINYGKTIQMDFIGFKASSQNLPSEDLQAWTQFKQDGLIKNLGNMLQARNMAYDQSFAYFGIYSLQEIAAYKARNRYVTFVEVEKHNYKYDVSKAAAIAWNIIGGATVGAGAGMLLGSASLPERDRYIDYTQTKKTYNTIGGILLGLGAFDLLMAALNSPKTVITFEGKYNIYVYDTQKQEIIYKDSVLIGPKRDTYKGIYDNPSTNRSSVVNYYSSYIYNALIKKYSEINKWLSVDGESRASFENNEKNNISPINYSLGMEKDIIQNDSVYGVLTNSEDVIKAVISDEALRELRVENVGWGPDMGTIIDEIEKEAYEIICIAQKKAGTNFNWYKGKYSSSSGSMGIGLELKNGYVLGTMYYGKSRWVGQIGFVVAAGEHFTKSKDINGVLKVISKKYGWKYVVDHYGNRKYFSEEIEKPAGKDLFKAYLSDYEKASDELAEILKCFK